MNWNSDSGESDLKIQLLLFATAADAVGQSQMELIVPEGSTAKSVCNSIDSLVEMSERCAFAIDHAFVNPDTSVTDGCTLAILPPVSGG